MPDDGRMRYGESTVLVGLVWKVDTRGLWGSKL